MLEDPASKYTLEEYWKLVEALPNHKYEYINGYIRMMTGGTVPHGEIGANIVAALHAALRDSECHVYSSDVAVNLLGLKCYYPDASVSCDPYDWTRKKAIEAPTVVVEVLSPTTEQKDKTEKLEAYQSYPTIQEILFIDSRKRYIEHYHRTGEASWSYAVLQRDDEVLDLPSIEVKISVRDVYWKVYLELEEARLEE